MEHTNQKNDNGDLRKIQVVEIQIGKSSRKTQIEKHNSEDITRKNTNRKITIRKRQIERIQIGKYKAGKTNLKITSKMCKSENSDRNL